MTDLNEKVRVLFSIKVHWNVYISHQNTYNETLNSRSPSTYMFLVQTIFWISWNFIFVIESFLSLEQLKQFNDENISAEDLLATVLNSSAPSSGQPMAGDLVMIVMGMDTVLSNLNSTQRMASAKVNYIGLLLCRCGNYLTIRFLW